MMDLHPYRLRVEEELESAIASFGEKTQLRDACEYALTCAGKRFRPALVYMIAEALGCGHDVTHSALAIEFFHTASLIADDLPCMDDDALRRDKPTLHKVYGESIAILTTYALIAAGYERIRLNAASLKAKGVSHADTLGMLALENASFNTGILGATGGQYLDLFPSSVQLKETMHKKTATLFEISFVFGWLFGGGDVTQLEKVKQTARHFGLAFQIHDDLLDYDHDLSSQNYARSFGKERAQEAMQQELASLESCLSALKLTPLLHVSL